MSNLLATPPADPWQALVQSSSSRVAHHHPGRTVRPLIEVSEVAGRVYLSFPLCFEDERQRRDKCDTPACCFQVESLDDHVSLRIWIEDRAWSEVFELDRLAPLDARALCAGLLEHAIEPLLPLGPTTCDIPAQRVAAWFESRAIAPRCRRLPIPRYDGDDRNLKDIDWLIETFSHDIGRPVDHGPERILAIPIGARTFEVLESRGRWLLLHNVPTLDVLDALITEGLLPAAARADFVPIDAEHEARARTREAYTQHGHSIGEAKDYRAANHWRNATPNFAYDPVRGLYYLSVAGEPVMDEFERPYIELLGELAARSGGVVLEIGFGMGISAASIQKTLHRFHADHPATPVAHVIIEYNRHLARMARQWAAWQRVPVVILDGDWVHQIRLLPDGILAGALSDPYPLNPSEKHKDAALALAQIHRCLRPGGVSVHYADNQYHLAPDDAAIARAAGFAHIAGLTSTFGRDLNAGEYYTRGLRMLAPVLRKGPPPPPPDVVLDTDEARLALWRALMCETTSSWAQRGTLRGLGGGPVRD